jgi:OOP family OmpA-OmpF porin
MKFLKSNLAATLIIALALSTFQACKTKKLAQQPAPVKPAEQPAPVAVTPPPAPAAPVSAPAPKPDYSFNNIQFDFNSSVLKTESYPILDKAALNMKMDPSVKFSLSGYASIEGTEEHNMQLSEDRANSVKQYLVNSGVSADNLTAKGYGTANPIGDNNTEAGRELNRRVAIAVTSGQNSTGTSR